MNIPSPTDIQKILRKEVAYADGVDFISLEFVQTRRSAESSLTSQTLGTCLKNRFHHVISGLKKLERNKESRITHWRQRRRRKQLPTDALTKLKTWIGGYKLKRDTKVRPYKALVKSIFTYNCGTWALTQTHTNRRS